MGTASGLEEQLWSSPALSGGGADPAVYVGANESLVAVSQAGGVPRILWSVRTKAAIFASPTVGDDGVIFIGSLDSTMRAVAPDGTTLWVHKALAPIYASAAVSSDAVYFSTLLDGRVIKGAARRTVALEQGRVALADPELANTLTRRLDTLRGKH